MLNLYVSLHNLATISACGDFSSESFHAQTTSDVRQKPAPTNHAGLTRVTGLPLQLARRVRNRSNLSNQIIKRAM